MEQQIMTSSLITPPSLTQVDWLDAVRDDLQLIENKMRESAVIGSEQLDPAVQAIISAGGKRLRPAITILIGRMFEAHWNAVASVAASIELLHTATLIHDDLIDGADERRSVPTLHSRIPIGVTVLTGDFLFAKAAALAAEANSVPVVQLFSETLVKICRGEILQAQTRWQVPSQAIYEERIYGKTAALFEAAALAAALLGDTNQAEIKAAADYGRFLGLAFQIIDDALDFEATTERLGKPAGHDMRQGIFNLPIMFYVQEGYITAEALTERVTNQDRLDDLVANLQATGMVQKSIQIAQEYTQRANQALAQTRGGDYLPHLEQITAYAIARAH